MPEITYHIGDCRTVLKELPSDSIDCCVTSPPYYQLRDYNHPDQIGLEQTPEAYVNELVQVFREVRRVLKPEGTLWLNLGDSYFSNTKGSGGTNPETSPYQARKGKENYQSFETRTISTGSYPLKPKDLIGIPWHVAFALQEDGWWLRQDIIFQKANPMPESVKDRCTKSHEYVFLLSKSQNYYFDYKSIQEPVSNPSRTNYQCGSRTNGINEDRNDNDFSEHSKGKVYETRNKRSVWKIVLEPFTEAHFATFPIKLIEPCILAGCPEYGTVIDPFAGSGTVGRYCKENYRNAILIELNQEYEPMLRKSTDADIAKLSSFFMTED